jgi:hypothetical protein
VIVQIAPLGMARSSTRKAVGLAAAWSKMAATCASRTAAIVC